MGEVGNAFAGKGASGELGCMSSISTALCRLSKKDEENSVAAKTLDFTFHIKTEYASHFFPGQQ